MRVYLAGTAGLELADRLVDDWSGAGRQGRLMFAYLAAAHPRAVPRDELAEALWGGEPPVTWQKGIGVVASRVRKMLMDLGAGGPEVVAFSFNCYQLCLGDDAWIDIHAAAEAVARAESAMDAEQWSAAMTAAVAAVPIVRREFLPGEEGLWVEAQRDALRDLLLRALDCHAQAALCLGRPDDAIKAANESVVVAPFRETGYLSLMRAHAARGNRAEALKVYERCRRLLVEELGMDPSPALEDAYVGLLHAGEEPEGMRVPTAASLPSGVVTFLLSDIEGSTRLWEADPAAMADALGRHDELVAQAVSRHGGHLLKARGEGDATFSVFRRASDAAAAAAAAQEALNAEAWPASARLRVRMAVYTGEAVERGGDYFGTTVNRAARLRALAAGGQVLVSQSAAEVLVEHLPVGLSIVELGPRALKDLARPEQVFTLVGPGLEVLAPGEPQGPLPILPVPAPLAVSSDDPFVGRDAPLDELGAVWKAVVSDVARATFVGGEPGVGKTRLAAEWARRAHEDGALVLYGRSEEDLGAPYQPFAEALRSLVPNLGARRLRAVRGIEEVARLVPEVADVLFDLRPPTQSDPETERAVLFDAVARLFATAAAEAPTLIVLDDLQWAAKPTLLLLRHILRFANEARLHLVATFRSTDLGRDHPLAATLADLQADDSADCLYLSGLEQDDIGAYLAATGHDDEHLAGALTTVTAGNPFFLIEILRHLEESGGTWDPATLPHGVRQAVWRRVSRLSKPTCDALLVGAVAGNRFAVDLVEAVLDTDLTDAFEETFQAGILIEEAGARARFNHALVRQALLAEVGSLKRVRLHRRIATALEVAAGNDNEAILADLAYHWFECAEAGGATKAVDACRRAARQAMTRLAYEEAAELYDRALQAAEVEGSGCDEDARVALLVARCDALLAAGDVATADAAVAQLQKATRRSPAHAAWATCLGAELRLLTHPEDLAETEAAAAAAAVSMAALGDDSGEAQAHTIHARCLARLGRVADCEVVLDRALVAARRSGDPRRINAVLAGGLLAALWGPSPVARAGGRCLDIVRVLRMTTDSAAVQASALRCRAVLEAMRGHFDAARRMLRSARRSVESLGHAHGLLETDLFSGLVELLAGDAAAAEGLLTYAHQGFADRGVGADAAQAAALLARAFLAQDRVDEAIAMTEESERLAGVDLKAAIAWRTARAEALARRGCTAEAFDMARAAVALVDPTDALLDQGDAHRSLAAVLAASGDAAEAEHESRLAFDCYERKGATAWTMTAVEARPGSSRRRGIWSPPTPHYLENDAHRRVLHYAGLMFARDWAAFEAGTAEDVILEDRRPIVGWRAEGRVGAHAYTRSIVESGVVEGERSTVVATRGERLVVHENVIYGRGFEVETLSLNEYNAHGLWCAASFFDLADLDAALQDLDERYAAGEGAAFTETLASIKASVAAWNAKDGARARVIAILRLRHDGAVIVIEVAGTDNDEKGLESKRVGVVVGGQGRTGRMEVFSEGDIDAALARFDELTSSKSIVLFNDATGHAKELTDLLLADNWDRVAALIAPDVICEDRRAIVGRPTCQGRDAALASFRAVREVGVTAIDITPVAVRGNRLALFRSVFRGSTDREGNDVYEVETLSVEDYDSDGVWTGATSFDPADLDAAFENLDERFAAGEGARFTETLASVKASIAASDARDVRVIAIPHLRRDGAVCVIQATGNESSGSGLGSRRIAVIVNRQGRASAVEEFEEDNLDAALARFDELTDPPAPDYPDNDAVRHLRAFCDCFLEDDWDRLAALTAPDAIADDRRAIVGGRGATKGRDNVVAGMRLIREIGVTAIDITPVAVRGERLALVRLLYRGSTDAEAIESYETEILGLVAFDTDGRWLRTTGFDPDDVDAALEELDARYTLEQGGTP